MPSRSVLFIEDDRAYQRALTALLAGGAVSPVFATTGAEALGVLARGRFDVCVVDLGLPDVDGVELIQRVCRLYPKLPLVVLSIASSETRILGALRAGASGYILKEDAGRLLERAVEEVLEWGAPMSPAVARLVLSEVRAKSGAHPGEERAAVLSGRELEVIELLAKGLSYGDVGTALGVSVNTVRAHVRSIYDKLLVASKTEAVMAALRLGLIQAPA